MRLIDADAIISRIKPLIEAERQIFKKASWNFAEKCLTVVESAPTVSAYLPTGEWEEISTSESKVIALQYMRCSTCKRWHIVPYLYKVTLSNYCPNCGAVMAKGEKNETD